MPPESSPARSRSAAPSAPGAPLVIDFDDNRLLAALCGEYDRHLARIEQQLSVTLAPRGNRLAIAGPPAAREAAEAVLNELYRRLKRGQDLENGDIDGVIRMALTGAQQAAGGRKGGRGKDGQGKDGRGRDTDGRGAGRKIAMAGDFPALITRKRPVTPRSANQGSYLQALESYELVFGLGPAGTGKTYLAVAMAVTMLLSGRVDRIILSRPAVEAGERLGFLPGDMREKVDPYLRPLYDALYDMLPGEQVVKYLESGEIEVAPLAFMRGRTLANAFVILDEAQNATPVQMKMLLTRLGENSRMVVTGDLSQVDLPLGMPSGLRDAVSLLEGVEGIAVVWFSEDDVVRHPLVTRVVRAYAQRDGGLGLVPPKERSKS